MCSVRDGYLLSYDKGVEVGLGRERGKETRPLSVFSVQTDTFGTLNPRSGWVTSETLRVFIPIYRLGPTFRLYTFLVTPFTFFPPHPTVQPYYSRLLPTRTTICSRPLYRLVET